MHLEFITLESYDATPLLTLLSEAEQFTNRSVRKSCGRSNLVFTLVCINCFLTNSLLTNTRLIDELFEGQEFRRSLRKY